MKAQGGIHLRSPLPKHMYRWRDLPAFLVYAIGGHACGGERYTRRSAVRLLAPGPVPYTFQTRMARIHRPSLGDRNEWKQAKVTNASLSRH
jgi:hypothetical protein